MLFSVYLLGLFTVLFQKYLAVERLHREFLKQLCQRLISMQLVSVSEAALYFSLAAKCYLLKQTPMPRRL